MLVRTRCGSVKTVGVKTSAFRHRMKHPENVAERAAIVGVRRIIYRHGWSRHIAEAQLSQAAQQPVSG